MAELKATVYPTLTNGNIYSSLTGLIKNHIVSRIPNNYIKNIYIRNSAFSVTQKDTNDEELLTNQKPILAIGVNYDYQEAVSYGDHLKWALTQIPKYAYTKTSIYKPILIDEPNNIFISSVADRQRITFDIGFSLSSEVQAMNLIQYIRYNFGINRPYYINNALLEAPIPSSIFNIILNKLNISYKDNIKTFNDYLFNKSSSKIQFKKNLSSGNYLYYLVYGTNIFCRITDAPSIEKNMDGKSVSSVDIKFTLEAEFFNHVNFITETEILDLNPNIDPVPDDGLFTTSYSYMVSMPIKRQDVNGFNIGFKTQFVTDINQSIDSTIFKDQLPNNFIVYMKYLLDNNIDVKLHTSTLLFVDDNTLSTTEYEVDWDTFTIKLFQPMMNYVYTFAIYVDSVHYNSVVPIMDNIPNYENSLNIKPQKNIHDIIN